MCFSPSYKVTPMMSVPLQLNLKLYLLSFQFTCTFGSSQGLHLTDWFNSTIPMDLFPFPSPTGADFIYLFFVQKDIFLALVIVNWIVSPLRIESHFPSLVRFLIRSLEPNIFPSLTQESLLELIGIHAWGKWRTTFNTRNGNYEFMLLGLCTSLVVFQ